MIITDSALPEDGLVTLQTRVDHVMIVEYSADTEVSRDRLRPGERR